MFDSFRARHYIKQQVREYIERLFYLLFLLLFSSYYKNNVLHVS